MRMWTFSLDTGLRACGATRESGLDQLVPKGLDWRSSRAKPISSRPYLFAALIQVSQGRDRRDRR